MEFDLPTIIPDAKPEFTDSKTCSEWLETLPLINVGPSHGRVLGQIEELNSYALAPAERLKILELLREPAIFLQSESAKKFANRPVPLGKQEREILANVIALWDALSCGYRHCLKSFTEDQGGLSGQTALICQRLLWCTSQHIAEHYKVFQQVGAEDWAMLNRLYAVAEDLSVAGVKTSHPLLGEIQTTCTETYVQALLVHLANPYEMVPRQLALVLRWLDRWVRRIGITREPPASELGIAPLAVDLAGSSGASHGNAKGETVRFLDLEELAKNTHTRVALLRKGDSPDSLGLGDGVSAGAAEQLLVLLYRRWCEDKSQRASPRRPASAKAHLCSGILAMHHYISGLPFRQPGGGEAKELTKAEREQLAIFGRVSTRDEDDYSWAKGFALEQWEILDESPGGLKLERRQDKGGGRFVHQQAVAVRPSDGKHFMIGVVNWLSISENYELRLGLRVLPGVPVTVAVRPTGLNVSSEKYVAGLCLQAVPALRSPATLILPTGWFRPKRVIEVFSHKSEAFLLTGILERGSDFERCTFAPA